jgi:hypothetical protein
MKGKGEGSEWSEKKKEWRTKKMRKDMRDKKEIEKEMDEAEAEVDEEEAGRNVSLSLWSSVPHPACCIPWLTL